jgi:hypothetical protein
MKWLEELKKYSECGLFLRNKCDGVEMQSKHARMLWAAWDLPRLIAIAEKAAYNYRGCPFCFDIFHKGEDIHEPSCPYHDDWTPNGP